MHGELAGRVWWQRIDDAAYDVFLQTDRAVYRCSSVEGVWREVDSSPDPRGMVFNAPLDRTITRCLSGTDGCRYVFFSDGTAIRVFNPPPEPGWVTIHSNSATFWNEEECRRLLEENAEMPETAVVLA